MPKGCADPATREKEDPRWLGCVAIPIDSTKREACATNATRAGTTRPKIPRKMLRLIWAFRNDLC